MGSDVRHYRGVMAPRARSVGLLAGAGVALILVAALAGVLISVGLLANPNAVDAWWSMLTTSMRSPVTIAIALGFNALGRGLVAALVVPVVLVVLLLVARRPWSAVALVAAVLLTSGLTRLLKAVVARDRPEDILVQSDFGSFPSGHASNAAAIVAVLALVFRSVTLRVLLVLYLVGMMWSRMLLGAHWATDVVGGAFLGVGVAMVVVALARPLLRREPVGWSRRG